MAKKPELLAPAGSWPALVAAVNAGADAVYFGLQDLNMRSLGKNFKLNDLKKISNICKSKGVKIYLTLNTIVYDSEIPKLERIIKAAKKFVDAIICWDLAVIELCKKHKIEFHISTQASVSNIKAAQFYKKLGAKRIVLARELNLRQIKQISKIIDVECFAHGAMCASISGRCFTSQMLFNKSANRGECIHPCRRTYLVQDLEGNKLRLRNNKIFSAKDLCTLPFIDKLKAAGITAFKIEGRNRDPRYVDKVIKVYRKALDKKLSKEEIKIGIQELNKVYNKGFSTGFYLGLPTSDDFAKIEHSAATEKKVFVGKVTHFYPKISVAEIKIIDKPIKPGDKLCIIGKTTGVLNLTANRIEIQHKQVAKTSKGDEIAIQVPSRIRKNDEVYLIKKN